MTPIARQPATNGARFQALRGEPVGIETLLSQPEIIAWLELSDQQVVDLLNPDERESGEAPRAA